MLLSLVFAPRTLATIIAYESDSAFPEAAAAPWTRVGTLDATRWLWNGRLYIDVDLGVWAPPPGGEQDFYQRSIAELQGFQFFVEWRCRSNAPNSEIVGSAGAFINSWGSGANYHFTITADTVRFWRSNFLPILYFTIAPNQFHTYRVETFGAQWYKVFLDSELVDSGTPAAAFPNPSARIIWGAKMWNTPSLNEWDYVRYGTIPQPGSGDYDSNGVVDATDVYFFLDCLLGPDANGPGCRWADLNGDGKVNGDDIQPFAAALVGP